MSSRKRKLSTVPETSNGTSSKRAKLLSDLWSSQEERSDRGGPGQAGISSTVYTIKAIIGERESEYLIDWADDPITGGGFQPDWVRLLDLDSVPTNGILSVYILFVLLLRHELILPISNQNQM